MGTSRVLFEKKRRKKNIANDVVAATTVECLLNIAHNKTEE